MGDIFWDEIKEDKLAIIESIHNLCDSYGIEKPILNTHIRIEVLQEKKDEILKLISNSR